MSHESSLTTFGTFCLPARLALERKHTSFLHPFTTSVNMTTG
jgi:hypothetical protein